MSLFLSEKLSHFRKFCRSGSLTPDLSGQRLGTADALQGMVDKKSGNQLLKSQLLTSDLFLEIILIDYLQKSVIP